MEKAWAKLHGSYCAIIAGNTEKVVRDLTGAPYETFKLSEANLWQKLLTADKNDWVMNLSTPNTAAGDTDKGASANAGIVPGHAYALLSVYEI